MVYSAVCTLAVERDVKQQIILNLNRTDNILCIQPGALVQTMGKARCNGTLN